MKKRKRWKYAYYIGDELIASGTRNEICSQLGINYKTFHWYRTKTYKNKKIKNENKRRIIIRTDEDLQY